MFLILNNDGMRYCQDGFWRDFAHFGTYPECVKEYRTRGWAENKAKKIKGKILEILPGQGMDH